MEEGIGFVEEPSVDEGDDVAPSVSLPTEDKTSSDLKEIPKAPEKAQPSFFRALSSKVFSSDTDNDQKIAEKEIEEKRKQLIKKLKEYHNKPFNHEYWIRAMDYSNTIYYYNTMTGETSWLPTCSVCFSPSEKWCIQCNAAFCQKHLIKKHQPSLSLKEKGDNKEKSKVKPSKVENDGASVSSLDDGSLVTDPNGLLNHEWSDYEFSGKDGTAPVRPRLLEHQEFCLECQLNLAEQVCSECWDRYCTSCFQKIHRVGSLKLHQPLPYDETMSNNWYTIRAGQYGNTATIDRYINGETQESTYEKPRALMNSLEGKFYDQWKLYENGSQELYQMIDELQFEIEKAKYEKEKMLLEMQEMQKNFKTRANISNDTGIDIEALFQQNQSNQSEYRQILLNPTDRKRGQARAQYIKALLELPFPT